MYRLSPLHKSVHTTCKKRYLSVKKKRDLSMVEMRRKIMNAGCIAISSNSRTDIPWFN